MRNKKLLLALTLPAVFAACNNEEILTEAPVNNMEIVGANLVSEGLVINVKNGVESRLTTGGWEMTDELGLGWLNAKGNIYEDQKGGSAVTDIRVYANHLFKKNENGAFSTYGNVYEGYHFAYYAYQYMPQAGQMTVTVNPEQKEVWNAEHLNSTFHISAQDFITVDKVDANTRELKDVTFEVVPAVNELAIRIVPDAQFTDDEVLSGLNIKNIALTANTGKTPFYSTIQLQPRHLPTIVYNKDGEYDGEKTLKKMTAANLYLNGTTVTSHAKAPIVRSGESKTLTTDVTDEACDLSGNQIVRMFNTPVSVLKNSSDLTDKADASKYTIKVTVSAGNFNVKYTKNAEEGSYAASNNAALEEIAGLLSKEGYGDDEINFSELIETQGITLYLDASMFKADYSKITSKDDWEDCVALADALGEEGPVTFNVINEVKFEDGKIPMPNCAVEVSSSSKGALIIENDVTWPATLTKKADKNLVIKVKETGTLNVNSVVDATTFENYGVINAGPLSSISTAATATLVNKARVIVEYGAYVYPTANEECTIAYYVDGTESAAKINTLIANVGNKHGHAKVNTLILENEVELDLTKNDGSDVDNDRYNGSTLYGSELADMTDVAIELNGGSIIAALNKVKNVHNVTVKGGENTIKDVDVMGILKVEAGSVTVDATEYTVERIEDGEKVEVKVKNAADVNAIKVDKSGTLNVTVDTYTSDIVNNGSINVADPYTLRYANSIKQSGSQSGNIVKGSINLATAIAAGGEITLMENVVLSEALNLTSGNSADINLNDKTITGSIQTNADLTVKNGEIVNENNDKSAIEINKGKLTLEDVTVTSARHAVRIDGQVEAEIKSGIYKTNPTSNLTLHALNVSGNAKVIIYGGTFIGPKGTMADSGAAVNVQTGAEVVIEGGNFSGGFNNTLSSSSKGTLIVKGGTFDQDPSAYVPVGYVATNVDAIWTVTKI